MLLMFCQVYGRRTTPDSLTNSLNLARKAGSPFCDVQLRVDGYDFPAHRAVLSATSSVFMVSIATAVFKNKRNFSLDRFQALCLFLPLFQAMFTGEFKEKTADSVIIEGVSKEAFGRFLDFLYTEDIASWEGCELELLDLSERYQVGTV